MSSNYIPYISISANPNCEAWIPTSLAKSCEQVKNKFLNKFKTPQGFDSWVAGNLGVSSSELYNILSAEQIDAVGAIIENISNNSSTILADETGVGKGRALASLYKYCQLNNKKMLFFTYNKELFSDFVRDLEDVGVKDFSQMHALHNSVKVFNKNSDIVFKANKKQNTQRINNLDISGISLMFCTYAQINSKKSSSNAKMEFLQKYCQKDCLVVLDESHNAAGQSNTQKNISLLLKHCPFSVFASATFLKNETELDLYKNVLSSFSSKDLKYFTSSLELGENELLRSYLSEQLVANGKLIRREHEPMNAAWSHCSVEHEKQSQIMDSTSEIFSDLFAIIEGCSDIEGVYEGLKNSWYLAGGHINRVFKNILLLIKIQGLVKEVQKDIKDNKKSVIVLESTFSSMVSTLIDNAQLSDSSAEVEQEELEVEVDKKTFNLSFKSYIKWIFEQVIDKNLPSFGLEQIVYDKVALCKQKIDSYDDSWASLSPIDSIKESLKKLSINCLEVSGRGFNIQEDTEAKTITLKQVEDKSRTQTIADFNNGLGDVIILTRAGSTGFSLHSSSTFKDQRVRVLYELEISNRPQVRLQFIGRVRRRGQVCEPEFKTIVTNLPFEARLVEQQKQKLQIMNSHTSAYANRLLQENIINLYSSQAASLAKQLLQLYPKLAFKMGISLKSNDMMYYIDMLLKRCVILTSSQSSAIMEYLIEGLRAQSQNTLDFSYGNSTIESMKTFMWDMSESEKETFKAHYAKNKSYGFDNVSYCWSSLCQMLSCYELPQRQLQEVQSVFNTSLDITNEQRQALLDYLGAVKSTTTNQVQIVKNIKKGSYINFSCIYGKIWAVVSGIRFFGAQKMNSYPTHCMVDLMSVGSHQLKNSQPITSSLSITLDILLSCQDVSIKNPEQVDFSLFTQEKVNVQKRFFAVLGNPIFISFLQRAYQIGYVSQINVENQKKFALVITQDMTQQDIQSLRKVVFDIKNCFDLLLNAKKTLFTSASSKFEGPISLNASNTGVNLFIHKNYSDKKVIDYAMYKALGEYKINGQQKMYLISYKKIFKILAMLDKRGIFFFYE